VWEHFGSALSIEDCVAFSRAVTVMEFVIIIRRASELKKPIPAGFFIKAVAEDAADVQSIAPLLLCSIGLKGEVLTTLDNMHALLGQRRLSVADMNEFNSAEKARSLTSMRGLVSSGGAEEFSAFLINWDRLVPK
jgi:hypothetical protein